MSVALLISALLFTVLTVVTVGIVVPGRKWIDSLSEASLDFHQHL
jgi:ABC-type proline/glycine betaine transport system permease subunit